MRKQVYIIVGLLLLCPLAANAFTITFDDISNMSQLFPYTCSGVDVIFQSSHYGILDATNNSWCAPHSGNNALAGTGSIMLMHGPYGPDGGTFVPADYFSAYFSTKPNVVVQLVFYNYSKWKEVGSITIGKRNESWNNTFVEFDPGSNYFDYVGCQIVNLPYEAEEPFICMDDVTINPVPEPSGILALLAGVAGIGGMAWRRR